MAKRYIWGMEGPFAKYTGTRATADTSFWIVRLRGCAIRLAPRRGSLRARQLCIRSVFRDIRLRPVAGRVMTPVMTAAAARNRGPQLSFLAERIRRTCRGGHGHLTRHTILRNCF